MTTDYEKFSAVFEPDFETGLLYYKVERKNMKVGDIAGCVNKRGYCVITHLGKQYFGHRLIWLLYYKEWPKTMLDHINRVKSFNAINNLRECTNQENQMNGLMQLKPGLGITVSRCGTYKVRIGSPYFKHIGSFKTLSEAYKARDAFWARIKCDS